MKNVKSKVISSAMAVVLALGMAPGFAFAGQAEPDAAATPLTLSAQGMALGTQAYYYPPVVTAPIEDMTTGTAVNVDPADYEIESSVYYTSSTKSRYLNADGTAKVAPVKLYASELPMIKQTADGEAAYVAGFGLEVAEGDTYAMGYGAAPAEPEFAADNISGTFEKGGKSYVAFYFSNAKSFTGVNAYVAVKHASGDTTIYNVDLTDVYTDAELAQGLYQVNNFMIDDKDDYSGMINADPTDAPTYIRVKDGKVTLLVRVYNANKYDYIWVGDAADRPTATEADGTTIAVTDDMVMGVPVPADAEYVANGIQKANVFTDANGIYGAKGGKYKAMYYELPITQADVAAGKVFFNIRRTPGLTSSGGKWMGTSDHWFNISSYTAVDASVDVDLTLSASDEGIDAAIKSTNMIPYAPTADDMAAYAAAKSAYISLDYSPTDYAPRAWLDALLPEVAEKIDAADAAIPDVIPADGTYTFVQSLKSFNYPSIAEGVLSDSLYSGTLVVKDGKMTVTVAQRRGSYHYVFIGLPTQAMAAQTAAGSLEAMLSAGTAYSFDDETAVYLDHAEGTTGPDGDAESDAAGIYNMYTATFPLQSLEKPIPLAFRGSGWYNRSFVFHAANLFKSDTVDVMRAVDKLVNAPDPEDPDNPYGAYKVDPSLLTDANAADVVAASDAYMALDEAGKAELAKQLIFGTPADVADGQTYEQALKAINDNNIAWATATLAQTSVAYNGKAQTPAVTVKSATGKTLVNGTDYTVAYANNTNVGTAKVTITGKGQCSGKLDASFAITKGASTITIANKKATYNGKAVNVAAAKVTGSAGKVTYTYYSDKACTKVVSAHKNAGTYYVKATVAGDANYNGATSSVATVTIAKAKNTFKAKAVKAKQPAKTKKATTIKAKKAFKVTKNVSKGKVTYKKASGNKKITVSSTGKVTVKKGLKKGTYPVKVKLTSKATGNYKSATATVSFKVVVK